jgi:hypothetical protein
MAALIGGTSGQKAPPCRGKSRLATPGGVMRTQRAMAVATAIALAACSTDAITTVLGFLPSGVEPQGTQTTTITGFVEVYSESDVRLVVAESEIQLFGSIQEAARYGGSEVTLSGRT